MTWVCLRGLCQYQHIGTVIDKCVFSEVAQRRRSYLWYRIELWNRYSAGVINRLNV